MSRPSLALCTLGIRRTPGIGNSFVLPPQEDGAPAELSSGVNVVWGPNGVGKTSTAAAVERLLWPSANRDSRVHVHARLSLDGDEWTVEVDGHHTRVQRGGQDSSSLPQLPPPTERDRYRLSLHELLTATDRSLAEVVIHESAGGYDVQGARDGLGFRNRASQPNALRNDLVKARAHRADAEAADRELKEARSRLAELRDEVAGAERGAAERDLWQCARERLERLDDVHAAREALARLPVEIARLNGDEAERLREIDDKIGQTRSRLTEAQVEESAARRKLAEARLGDGGLPGDIFSALQKATAALDERERTVRERAGEHAEAVARLREAERTLTGAVTPNALADIRLPEVEEMGRLARDAEKHRGDVAAVQAELESLSGDTAPLNLDALRKGRAALLAWLSQPVATAAPSRLRALALAGGALTLVAGLALGVLANPLGYLLALAGAALLVGVLTSSTAPAADRRAEYRADYERTGLERPSAWGPDAIHTMADRVDVLIAQAELARARDERRRAVEARREGLVVRGAELAGQREAVAARLGVAPTTDEGALYWLCERIVRRQVVAEDVAAAMAVLEEASAQRDGAHAELVRLLDPYVTAEVGSPAELAGVVDGLRERREAHQEGRAALERAGERIRAAEGELDEQRQRRRELFARVGLVDDDTAALDTLCGQRGDYDRAREGVVRAEQDLATVERRLGDTRGFTEAVRAEPRASVLEKLDAAETCTNDLVRLRDEASDLNGRLTAAETGSDVEEALARVADAEAALRECRERDEAAVAGWAVAEFVQAAAREAERPQVFRRAAALFGKITRGRYDLDLSDSDGAAFRAVDTVTRHGCTLDEMSRGTRLQLLLSVRIAFIETMELGVRLPLILDEALGNTDDERAAAVMDVVVELARGGRQVFFFTARLDEAERWIEYLTAAGVEHGRVDLAAARKLGQWEALPHGAGPRRVAAPLLSPAGLDHDEYGRALRVPGVDPFGTADGVHLWHLVDDASLLYRLLSFGTEHVGSLRTLVRPSGPGVLGSDASCFDGIDARAQALDCVLEMRRVGRGRMVDREAISRSDAISTTFFDRVDAARKAVGGDPVRLLAEVAALPRFRGEAHAAFRTFLEDEGYLDTREPHSDDEVRNAAIAVLAPQIHAGRCTANDVERLLALVPAPERVLSLS